MKLSPEIHLGFYSTSHDLVNYQKGRELILISKFVTGKGSHIKSVYRTCFLFNLPLYKALILAIYLVFYPTAIRAYSK